MNDIYYLSNNNEKLYLDRYPYWMQTSDFLNYEWYYTVQNKRIVNFSKDVVERFFTITVFGNSEEDYSNNWREIHDVFEKDVRSLLPGKLYFGEYYLTCYVFSSEKTDWEYDCCMHDNTFILVTDKPDWIKESTKQFFPQSESKSDNGFDFPFDFPFDFALDKIGHETWNVDHYASSHFRMTIYGPCENPRILINGYPRQIFTSLESNEYLVIDSRDSTVIKHLANGTTVSVYNSRQFQPSIFEKIPSGLLSIDWTGLFGFDVTLFLERSEPKW